jgi:hypothetical protein
MIFETTWERIKGNAELGTSVATLGLAIATVWLAWGMSRQTELMQDDQRPWVWLLGSWKDPAASSLLTEPLLGATFLLVFQTGVSLPL